jgi:hypothetical protein
MAIIDLKAEHTLYDESKENGGINYLGHGAAFLKKDLSEPLQYCEELEREEAEELFLNHEEYDFGECNLEWQFTTKPPMGRGKMMMWFAKFWKNGYYEEVSL